MDTGKIGLTEADRLVIAGVMPYANARETSTGEMLAAIVAFVITLSALGLGYLFGVVETTGFAKVYNWPLIAALLMAVVYAWLFVALYSNVVSNGYRLDLLLKRQGKHFW